MTIGTWEQVRNIHLRTRAEKKFLHPNLVLFYLEKKKEVRIGSYGTCDTISQEKDINHILLLTAKRSDSQINFQANILEFLNLFQSLQIQLIRTFLKCLFTLRKRGVRIAPTDHVFNSSYHLSQIKEDVSKTQTTSKVLLSSRLAEGNKFNSVSWRGNGGFENGEARNQQTIQRRWDERADDDKSWRQATSISRRAIDRSLVHRSRCSFSVTLKTFRGVGG